MLADPTRLTGSLRKALRRRLVLIAIVLLGVVTAAVHRPIGRNYAASQLLRAMARENRSRPPIPGPLVEDLHLPNGTPIRARVYGPDADQARLSILLAHGIHHLGIEEPRLVRFARHLADRGCRVLTPELTHLANYHVNEQGIFVLRAGVRHMARAKKRVGLIGFSFAGGLSLLAATDPQTAAQLDYVASIGGYHDLHRSLRFLATHEVEGPRGFEARRAHEYGLLVLLYQHLENFRLGQDEEVFRALLEKWLEEDRKSARSFAEQLETTVGQTMFHLLESQKLSTLAPQLVELLQQNKSTLDALSPRGKLKNIDTEIILLHGAGDRVVPPEETLFAERELLRVRHPDYSALVTPLLEHVRVDHPGDAWDKLALLRTVARLL